MSGQFCTLAMFSKRGPNELLVIFESRVYAQIWLCVIDIGHLSIITDHGQEHCSTLDLIAMLTPPYAAPMDAARQPHLTTKVTTFCCFFLKSSKNALMVIVCLFDIELLTCKSRCEWSTERAHRRVHWRICAWHLFPISPWQTLGHWGHDWWCSKFVAENSLVTILQCFWGL